MYVCMYKHLGFKQMWSPPTRPCGRVVVGPGALKALQACWVILSLTKGWDWVTDGCHRLRTRLLGMQCAPWTSLPCMAQTRFLVTSTGRSKMLTLWLIVYVQVWSKGFTFLHGFISVMGLSWTCEEAVTEDGTRPQPSSFCMKAGMSCEPMIDFWSFSRPTGLMRSLAGPCSMFFACVVILNLMNWTKSSSKQALWLSLGRPLFGAYKMLRPAGLHESKHMEIQQALWACFLPGLLCALVISNGVRVIGCNVIQVARCSTPTPDASMCPLQLYNATDRALCIVWLLVRQYLIAQTFTWIRTHACEWLSTQFHGGRAQRDNDQDAWSKDWPKAPPVST